jgi:hypothetical protein
MDAQSISEQVLTAAKAQRLDQVPVEWLTNKTVTFADGSGLTPLHWAALMGQLSKLPARTARQNPYDTNLVKSTRRKKSVTRI